MTTAAWANYSHQSIVSLGLFYFYTHVGSSDHRCSISTLSMGRFTHSWDLVTAGWVLVTAGTDCKTGETSDMIRTGGEIMLNEPGTRTAKGTVPGIQWVKQADLPHT